MSLYDEHAAELARLYETLKPAELYGWAEGLLPQAPGVVLDVGAGTCRDAAWFAEAGHEVVAVEPSAAMRDQARLLHANPNIRLLPDALPSLLACQRFGITADVVLLSGVWQHMAPGERARAFRKLVSFTRSGGLMIFSLKTGPDEGRGSYPVDAGDVELLARGHGLQVVRRVETPDALGRPDVRWVNLALRVPDDGTGALPLLRHLILVDQKSSTYKLGLLRALVRAADGAAGLAVPDGEEHVVLPLGLLALNWLLLYLPLVKADLPQAPGNRQAAEGLGFAREGWQAVFAGAVSGKDLRIGAMFSGGRARAVRDALRDAANLIRAMPANHLTYADGRRILEVTRTRLPPRGETFVLDAEGLASFGTVRVPRHLWNAMRRFAVWIEPALVTEWSRLTRDYATSQGRPLDDAILAVAMAWSDPNRSVATVRDIALSRLEAGQPVHCVWSGRLLDAGRLDIDHCFPWVAWPCSDLWNLLPSDRRVNQHQKRDRLPSAEALLRASDRISAWWSSAYLGQLLAPRFASEAVASLPGLSGQRDALDPDRVSTAIQLQRMRLRQDQGVPEWSGAKV